MASHFDPVDVSRLYRGGQLIGPGRMGRSQRVALFCAPMMTNVGDAWRSMKRVESSTRAGPEVIPGNGTGRRSAVYALA